MIDNKHSLLREPSVNIIYKSNIGTSKSAVIDHLRAAKAANPALKVVDIGGAFNPWTAGVADAYVDMFPIEGQDVIIGDINESAVWDDIRRRNFDFCICSHTLEDIRDPIFVLGQMRELFAGGYIAVPNKHVEFSHMESPHYVGYGHHRWIFTLAGEELRMIAKFPLASFFSPRRRWLGRLKSSLPYQRLKKWLKPGKTPTPRDVGYLPWWREDLSGRANELAFIWSGPLNFKAINGDYAGRSTFHLAKLYADELAEGL